jgi:hypothetical protein
MNKNVLLGCNLRLEITAEFLKPMEKNCDVIMCEETMENFAYCPLLITL